MTRTLILSSEQVQRTLRRLAYEIIERNEGARTLVIFGIARSGIPLAEAVAAHIRDITGADVQAAPLDVTPFRDDAAADAAERQAPAPAVDAKDVVLVDDVLFTGRTVRAALDAVVQGGRPQSIQLAVLIDRGHREYPIQPDYVGRSLPTKPREQVTVDVEEAFAVYVEPAA
ncbi:bifunctional pyr operon transcriptional regulator/uracil phosphoribosyltransferase PyrR [Salisaeta longa]|uniref:bifunctional pyr operon transcriptional regulator/uracil phosphoribosyltransferase PyrR n=1 Tax=Salisaeta longa TaxID=503170 RepID=UPI000491B942|nr:bifunctional pyr operon transcriptional regulator/uracil phosphoribosyltransferase PyrR [Salisaeta longa]